MNARPTSTPMRPHRRLRMVAATLPLVLAGCSTIGEFQDRLSDAVAVTPPVQAQQIDPAPDEFLAQTVPTPRLKPAPPQRFASLAPTTGGPGGEGDDLVGGSLRDETVQLARANTSPDRLIGVIPGEILDVLGEPSMRLQEPPAEVWQYNSRSCTLRLTLLLDVVTEEHRSVFYEVKSANPEVRNGDSDCLAELLADRRARS